MRDATKSLIADGSYERFSRGGASPTAPSRPPGDQPVTGAPRRSETAYTGQAPPRRSRRCRFGTLGAG